MTTTSIKPGLILIVCPNLAVDRTLHCTSVEHGRVHRATESSHQAGGKGVNMARAMLRIAVEPQLDLAFPPRPHLLGLVGGHSGRLIREGLEAESISHDLISMGLESRTCTIVISPPLEDKKAATVTVFNETGPPCSRNDERALIQSFEQAVERASAVALMGSLPRGFSEHFYADRIRTCNELDVPTIVDTSHAALKAAIAAQPTVVKPNQNEARSLVRTSADTDWLKTLGSWNQDGIRLAMVSQGPDGVVASTSDWRARFQVPPPQDVVNPTGAGDTLAAGIITGMTNQESDRDSVRLGVACAMATLAHGYGRFDRGGLRLQDIIVTDLERP